MMSAFIIKRKRPNVIMVTGKVSTTKIGRTINLRSASTKATSIAVTKLSTITPGKIFERTTTAMAVRSSLIRDFIKSILSCF